MREHNFQILNQLVDISREFGKQENSFFNGMKVEKFDPASVSGIIRWKRYARKVRTSFNQVMLPFEESMSWEFPPEYGEDQELPFSIDFITPRTVRLRLTARNTDFRDETSLMLQKEPGNDFTWEAHTSDDASVYKSRFGSIKIEYDPFHVEFRDSVGRILTRTQHMDDTKSLQNTDPLPFSFVRKAEDLRRHIAASFTLSAGERIYGCGESFTQLNKRGQKINLWTRDAFGVQTVDMYKPIPFFMSNRGYGMFVHTSAPLTFDFGYSYDGANTMFLGDDSLDLFIFLGSPKEILSEYTALTGRSPVPPLWSFGLWMSRITYKSEEETREVAGKLREKRIPCDVVHLDTGWFETDWRCNYKFSESRFKEPEEMIAHLKQQGFHISLWQLPYFTPRNELYKEAIEKGYAVLAADGNLPTEDAIVDFSNPEAVKWYQGFLKRLFEMGIEAIKADFGEAAPLHGAYASGKSGFYEHNLYPLRYNKAVSEITEQATGSSIIWARSAWAGSQRYPLHWGGDAENTDCGMAATLRGGLSLGLSGFSFWSHDIGGFVQKSPEELYRRWMPFGMLSSHSRCHGAPPKEPWEYSESFMSDFRRTVELKYRLMPYIYTQAKICSEKGHPMLRTLFFEYPDDPTAWYIEDQYMLGSDLLVAPLLEENIEKRKVYLPEGLWIDYQTHEVYEGGKWHEINAGEIPVVLLVKDGTAIPHIKLQQCTGWMDWNEIELAVFKVKSEFAYGSVCFPEEKLLRTLRIETDADKVQVNGDNLPANVRWCIHVVN